MANLTITIPDAKVNELFDAIAALFGYNPAVDGTKAQFGRKLLINYLINCYKDYHLNQARLQSITDIETDIATNLNIT